MASGRTHTLATLTAGAAGVFHFAEDGNYLFASAWLAAALYCTIATPDNDQLDNGGAYCLQVARETWRPLERITRAYWMPYAKLFSHRSFYTHAPVVGTLIRLAYAMPYLVFALDVLLSPFGAQFVTAIIAMDALHWIMDLGIFPKIRMFTKRSHGAL